MQKPSTPEESKAAAARLLQGPAGLALFIATIFLSAFLLFALEPLFAKMVLPVLGGSSSVWAVALALLSGRAAGRLRCTPTSWCARLRSNGRDRCTSRSRCSPSSCCRSGCPPVGRSRRPASHICGSSGSLPWRSACRSSRLPPMRRCCKPGSRAADNRTRMILISSTPPPISAASTALLSYPFVLEPAFGLTALSRYWSAIYLILVAALALCFALVQRYGMQPRALSAPVRGEPQPAVPSLRDGFAWCGLAMVPAALLTAFTTHVATDIASAPLLWVIPLALYLTTFVLAFSERIAIPMRFLLPAHLLSVIFALLELSQTKYDKWVLTSATGVVVFFLSALMAHRMLFLARPRARYLTGFYLWMSLGGVLGGLFAALLAPKIFSEVYEYPLLIALTVACRPGIFARRAFRAADVLWLAAIVVVGVALVERGDIWAIQWSLSFGGWGFTPVLRFALCHCRGCLLGPSAAPVRGGALDVRDRRQSALGRANAVSRNAATTASIASCNRRTASSTC